MTLPLNLLDFGMVVERLRSEDRHRKLRNLLETAIALACANEDLRGAQVRMHSIIERHRAPTPPNPSNEMTMIVGSLFVAAVTMYARATSVTGGRRSWWGREIVPDHLRSVHDDAIRLRHEAVAHFGDAGHLPGGPMVRETLWRVALPDGEATVFRSRRSQHQEAFDAPFLELITAMVAASNEKGRLAVATVDAEIDRVRTFDHSLDDLFLACSSNLDEEAVARIATTKPGDRNVRSVIHGSRASATQMQHGRE